MIFVRPVAEDDYKEILGLASEAGIGMTSLPHDSEVLKRKIEKSVASFSGDESVKGDEVFLLVLEDPDNGKVVGTSSVVAHVGIKFPFYSYKLSTIVQSSKDVDVYSKQRILHLVNDYTGASELASLFVLPEYRRDGIGSFLSRCRYMMLAEFPELFSNIIISEIRGVIDENGDSPFYQELGKNFFQMEFKDADFANAVKGGQFISDLMPKYPIYVSLLGKKAQDVIGVALDISYNALKMLENEGFRYQGYVDVFDSGPTVQAERGQIRTVRKSKKATIAKVEKLSYNKRYIISTVELANFRVYTGSLEETDSGVIIEPEVAELSGLKIGDVIRYVEA
ncbi:MAG: arginine N-succinyltransferase [Rickettsiales bacterium]